MLVATLATVVIGFAAYRYFTRGQRREGAISELTQF
jgi:hypothetical protein